MEAGKMDPSKLYIQLGPVTPHSDPLDSTPRISPHEVNFNVSTSLAFSCITIVIDIITVGQCMRARC
jgi:hypothetical protein